MVGFYLIDIFVKRKFKKKFHYYISILFLITIIYKMFIYHPFQNIYFNNYFSKISHLNFEIDYWGLSGKKFLKEILALENNESTIKIGVASFLPLERSTKLLDKKDIHLTGSTNFLKNNNNHPILFGIKNLKEYLKSKKIEIR